MSSSEVSGVADGAMTTFLAARVGGVCGAGGVVEGVGMRGWRASARLYAWQRRGSRQYTSLMHIIIICKDGISFSLCLLRCRGGHLV